MKTPRLLFAICIAVCTYTGQANAKCYPTETVSFEQFRESVQNNLASVGDLDTLATQNRWSALLPEIEVDVSWRRRERTDRDHRETLEQSETKDLEWDDFQNEFDRENRSRNAWAVSGEWDFKRLLFSGDQVRIQRENRKRFQKRRELLDQLAEQFFLRKKLCRKWKTADSESRRVKLQDRIQLLEAKMNNATNGLFDQLFRRPGGK